MNNHEYISNYLERNYSHYDIFKASELVSEMRKEAEKYKKLLELAEQDRVAVIRNSVNWCTYVYPCQKAQVWLSKRGESKARKCEEKDYFNVLQNSINGILGQETEITKIISCGWESWAWEIYFRFNGEDFMIQIPDISKLTVKNISSMREGKICIFTSKEHCDTMLKESYDVEEIREAFEEHLHPATICNNRTLGPTMA